jgi:hypothetical protein
LLVALPARAGASDVGLEVVDCPTLSESALRELVDIELATLELSHATGTLEVRCVEQSAAIALERAGETYPVRVHVDLRDNGRGARERLVALAATELLSQAERSRAVPSGQRAQPPAPPPPTTQSASPPDRDAALIERASSTGRPQLYAAATVSLTGKPNSALWGGGLGASLGFGRHWALELGTRFERGREALEAADVRWSMLSGFVGPAYRERGRMLELSAALGVRGGWLAFDAEAAAPDEGRSLTAPWAGLALPVRVAGRFTGRVLPYLGVEGGYVLAPVEGMLDDGSVLIEQSGPWVAFSFGVGVEL